MIGHSPDFKSEPRRRLVVPLAGELGVDKLQVLSKRDVDKALAAANAALDARILALTAEYDALLKKQSDELSARIALVEKRLDGRH